MEPAQFVKRVAKCCFGTFFASWGLSVEIRSQSLVDLWALYGALAAYLAELIEHFLAKLAVIMDLSYFLGVCSYRYGLIASQTFICQLSVTIIFCFKNLAPTVSAWRNPGPWTNVLVDPWFTSSWVLVEKHQLSIFIHMLVTELHQSYLVLYIYHTYQQAFI